MKKRTMQQEFNTSVRGIFAQGGPSIRPDGECVYRGRGGKKCAIGHLIIDDEYDKKMDGLEGGVNVSGLIEDYKVSTLSKERERFYNNLQAAHDWSAIDCIELPPRSKKRKKEFFGGFVERVRVIAKNYNLKERVLNEEIKKSGIFD